MPAMPIPSSASSTTLRLGSTGPAVQALQQALNAILKQYSPLSEDGQFGGLTAGRVKTFQGSKGLVADAVVGPITWQAISVALGAAAGAVGEAVAAASTGAGATTTSNYDTLRPQIVAIAKQHIGRVDFAKFAGGKPQGLDFLIEMFAFATGIPFGEERFKTKIGSGWTWRPFAGMKDASPQIDWCGIFAVYCYKKAGVPVTWAGGQPVGPLRLRPISSGVPSDLKEGDIGCTGANNHHFIVETKSSGASPALTTIDGNLMWGSIARVNRQASVGRYYQLVQ